MLDGSSTAVTLSLKPAADIENVIYTIKAIDISNTVKIDPNSSETIDGSTDYTFSSQYEVVTIISDGSNWHIIGN